MIKETKYFHENDNGDQCPLHTETSTVSVTDSVIKTILQRYIFLRTNNNTSEEVAEFFRIEQQLKEWSKC